MSELKTRANDADVEAFLATVADSGRRADCATVMEKMAAITGEPAKMWGSSIIGFGSYHYRYASGREGDWFVTGVAPRKQALTIYIMSGFAGYPELMAQLGRFKTGKSCLYVKKLTDVDSDILDELITRSAAYIAETYPDESD